jgi:hypothetical protein
VATALLAIYSAQRTAPVIRFQATNAADQENVMKIEPGRSIGATETQTGISADYWVNGVSLRFPPGGVVLAEWVVARNA